MVLLLELFYSFDQESLYPEPSFSVKSIGMKRMRWNRRKRILGKGGGEEKAQIDSLARGDVLSILYIQ